MGIFGVIIPVWLAFRLVLDCKTVGFPLKISKEIGKAWHIKSLTRGVLQSSLVHKVVEMTLTITNYLHYCCGKQAIEKTSIIDVTD